MPTVVALVEFTEVPEGVEHTTAERVARWLENHHAAITSLGTAAARATLDHIRPAVEAPRAHGGVFAAGDLPAPAEADREPLLDDEPAEPTLGVDEWCDARGSR